MWWQDLTVGLIVAGAVVFLLRRFGLLGRRASRGTETFVPLSSLRKPPGAPRQDRDGCH